MLTASKQNIKTLSCADNVNNNFFH